MSNKPVERSSTPAVAAGGLSCPRCGAAGRTVGALTLRSLLSPGARARRNAYDTFRFCATATCDVVYFDMAGDRVYYETDLTVPVFQKSNDPARLVCYCFDYTVAAVRDDVARSGVSRIAEDITEKCRNGLDRCEETNPQGSCCLGNVRRIAELAAAKAAATVAAAQPSQEGDQACCCPDQGSADLSQKKIR